MLCWRMCFILRLSLLLCALQCMEAAPRARRTIIGRYPLCPRGCTSCSPVNGCITCQSRHFLFLYRQHMRQLGICRLTCPPGYYGVRHAYYSACSRCGPEKCEACLSKQYCTRCLEPFVAFQGQCIERCPTGLYYANLTKDCQKAVDCVSGSWSEWSQCSRRGHTCGFKWGVRTRSRHILQSPSPNGQPCPASSLSRKCRLSRRWCSDEECKRRKGHRKRKRHRKHNARKKNQRRKGHRKKKRGHHKGASGQPGKGHIRRVCRHGPCGARRRNPRRRRPGCKFRRQSRLSKNEVE